jgi:transposase, IS30 family
MSYTHLSASERFTLYQYRKKDHLTLDEIALKMNCSKSTISRELERNSLNKEDYLPDSAHLQMQTRRRQSNRNS